MLVLLLLLLLFYDRGYICDFRLTILEYLTYKFSHVNCCIAFCLVLLLLNKQRKQNMCILSLLLIGVPVCHYKK